MNKEGCYGCVVAGLAIVGVLLFIVASGIFGNVIQTTSEGSQFGEIVSIDKSKVMFTLGERYDVYVKSDAENSETIEFCMGIEKSELFEEAKEYSRSQQKVEVIYESYMFRAWDMCEWQITDIVPID